VSRTPIRAHFAKHKSRWLAIAAVVAVIAILLPILGYTLSNRRSTESLRDWVEQQNFVFLVPAQAGFMPGDVIQWPEVTPGTPPSGDFQLFEPSAKVLGFADESGFRRTGPFEVTLNGSVNAGLRAGAIAPTVAAQAKASGAEDFELVMKDVIILEAPIADLQSAILANPDLVQALRAPNRTVVSRILRPGKFHYRFSSSGSTGFAASFKRLFGGKNDRGVESGGKFTSGMEWKSDLPVVIGVALAKLDLTNVGGATVKAAVRPLKFEASRSLQTDGNAALWPVGSTLRVGFMERDAAREALFKGAMSEWLKYANLKVSYVDAADADIRVTFTPEFQSWSYVGSKALNVAKSQPTLTLGYPPNSPDARMSYLHEIGHALGLVHEFMNPQLQNYWNREAVYAQFAGAPNNWSKEQIDQNFFGDGGYPGSRPVDFQSVMGFRMPANLFRQGPGFTPGQELSQSDRTYVASLYPRDSA
jgi:hypothetical protein